MGIVPRLVVPAHAAVMAPAGPAASCGYATPPRSAGLDKTIGALHTAPLPSVDRWYSIAPGPVWYRKWRTLPARLFSSARFPGRIAEPELLARTSTGADQFRVVPEKSPRVAQMPTVGEPACATRKNVPFAGSTVSCGSPRHRPVAGAGGAPRSVNVAPLSVDTA